MELGLKRDEVRLVAYTEEWKKEFQRVKQEIVHATSISKNRIEHIGVRLLSEWMLNLY